MSSWIDYKGLQLPSPDPSGDAGNNIKQNFVILADRGIAEDSSLGSVAFVGGTVSEPTLDEDNDNLYWDNTNKRLGIGNNAPLTALDVNGPITVGTPSSSVPTPPSGKAVLFVHDNAGTLELKIKFSSGIEAVIVDDD